MNAKVWVLGDAVVDLLPESKGRLLQCPGGAPANVAVGVARLGGNSGFIGRVGDDPFGRFMRHTLQQEQVDISHMRLDGSIVPPPWWSILTTRGATFYLYGASQRGSVPGRRRPAGVCRQQWLHVCSIALSAEPSRSTTFAAMEKIK
jgi:fructokinase